MQDIFVQLEKFSWFFFLCCYWTVWVGFSSFRKFYFIFYFILAMFTGHLLIQIFVFLPISIRFYSLYTTNFIKKIITAIIEENRTHAMFTGKLYQSKVNKHDLNVESKQNRQYSIFHERNHTDCKGAVRRCKKMWRPWYQLNMIKKGSHWRLKGVLAKTYCIQ